METIIHTTDKNFKKDVLDSDIPVLVDFWATWCPPCLIVAPILEEIASEFVGKVKVVKLNVDENYKTAETYGIMSIPTLILFKDNKVVDKMIGAAPKSHIVKFISRHIT